MQFLLEICEPIIILELALKRKHELYAKTDLAFSKKQIRMIRHHKKQTKEQVNVINMPECFKPILHAWISSQLLKVMERRAMNKGMIAAAILAGLDYLLFHELNNKDDFCKRENEIPLLIGSITLGFGINCNRLMIVDD